MKIVNVGYNSRHPNDFCINRPNGPGDYVLMIVKSEAYIFLKEKKQSLPANSVIVFNKNTPQLYGASEGEYIDDWLHFEPTEKELARFCELGIPFDTILHFNDISELSKLIKNIFFERYSQNAYKEKSMDLYFELLLLKLSEKIKLPDIKKENPYYSDFSALRNEIFLKPQKNWNIEDISRKMNLSCSYIQHLYKSFFGESIISDVKNSRIEHAKYLLSSTDMTISCISQLCGYNNDVHFMRLFKKAVALTPSQYKIRTHISKEEVKNSMDKPPWSLKTDKNS